MVVDKYAISEMATFVMGKTSLFPLYLNVTMIDGILNSFLTDMDTGFHMIQFIIIYSTPWILSAIFLHVYRCFHVGYIHPDVWYSNWASKAENPGWNTQQIHTSPSVQNIYKREPHYAGPICDFPGFDDRHIHGIFRMHATYIRALWHLLFCLSRRTKPFLTLSGCNLKCLERILRVITLLQRARPPRI